eukprot:TRINITY_DN407_c0_g1_i1.p1 TRINITY_DN407_c0_g1~~TRINITY_DN407_c0_g1_i1.p1  ORF type:complete len:341 (-),score=66.42 TRINITY_DN407_c0_g1_i1:7-969(-)
MGPPVPQFEKADDSVSSPTKDFSPSSAEEYFDRVDDIQIPDTEDVFRVYQAGSTGTTFLLIHGGGHSALSWALTTKHMKSYAQVIALDLRGHGATQTSNDKDLRTETLCSDIVRVVNLLFEGKDFPPLLVVGHSMGGAIAAKVAPQLKKVCGLIVIDVVEGTALSSLTHMSTFIRNRPSSFSSIYAAVEWSVNSGTLKNVESAKISIPSQLVKFKSEYVWRTDLVASEVYWKDWFTDLSEKFLQNRVPKLLLLAGTDRLDKTLTIAQMQGKFQLHILPACGHVIQEDAPEEVASVFYEFMQRTKPLDLKALQKKINQPSN